MKYSGNNFFLFYFVQNPKLQRGNEAKKNPTSLVRVLRLGKLRRTGPANLACLSDGAPKERRLTNKAWALLPLIIGNTSMACDPSNQNATIREAFNPYKQNNDLSSLFKKIFSDSLPLPSILQGTSTHEHMHVLSIHHRPMGLIIHYNQTISSKYICYHLMNKQMQHESAHEPMNVTWIQYLGIDPDHQRKKYGTLLLKTIEQQALDNNIDFIVLDAYHNTEPFYQKCGYERTSPISQQMFKPLSKKAKALSHQQDLCTETS